MAHIPLLDEIDTFVRINQLSESAFGRLAVNDWKLLRQLREGFSESIRVTDLFRHVTLAAQTRFVASLVAPAAPRATRNRARVSSSMAGTIQASA